MRKPGLAGSWLFSSCWVSIWSSENQIHLPMKWALPAADSVGGLRAFCRSRTYTSGITTCPVMSVCSQSRAAQQPGVPQPSGAVVWHHPGQGFCPAGWAEPRYPWQRAGSVAFLVAAFSAHLFLVFKMLLVLLITYCYYFYFYCSNYKKSQLLRQCLH